MTDRLPLFNWREHAEVERLEAEREALRQRIARLRPMSHAAVQLRARLSDLTCRAMAIEAGFDREVSL